MTQKAAPSPFPTARVALSLLLFITLTSISGPVNAWAKDKRAAAPKKAAREDKKRERASSSSARDKNQSNARERNQKESRADKKRREREEREARASERGRGKDKSSAKDRRAARDDERDNAKGRGGKMSRRERLAEARRQAEERRREIEEARRRAEEARRAAIARQRAIEQAMRDEVAANVLKDDSTGEDLEVRRAAVAALGNHIGTVVVMNPKNGRVYTVVNQDWALRRGFKPCSTIKLVTGLAGLSENVISPETVNIANVNYRLDLTDALAYSNNGFFQNVGGQVGFERMVNYARQLGLGERTGINHANEYPGRVPVYKSGWALNRMCSHGDDFEVTAIQLATLTSAIANGGDLLVPHLPRTPQEDLQFKRQVRRHLDIISKEAFQRIVPGMIGSVNYGSGKKAYDPYQTVAGKTGTCIGQGGWLGLFTSYAPVYDPQMAIAVVMRGPDARGHIAAVVAGNIYKALNHRFTNVPAGQIANTPLIPRPKINPKAAAALNDEDKEEREAAAAEGAEVDDATRAATGTQQQGGTVKSTVMSYPSRKAEEPVRQQQPQTTPQLDGRPRRVLTPQ